MKYILSLCLMGICIAGAVYFYFDKDYSYVNLNNQVSQGINRESLLYMCLCLIPILPLILFARRTYRTFQDLKQDSPLNVRSKADIIAEFDALENKLNEYLFLWKKKGGGTKGYAIGSAIKRMSEIKKFFSEYC